MARIGPSQHDVAGPSQGRHFVVAGVAGDPSDASILDAATALARSRAGSVHPLHVERGGDAEAHVELELARVSDELDAELLVIGCRTLRDRRAPGTTTRGLLAEPHRPVWLQRGAWSPPDRIVAAIDEPERDEAVLEQARELARGFRASLAAVHCQWAGRPGELGRDRSWFERWVRERLEPAGADLDVEILHVAGPPLRALADPIGRADVAVLGRGRRRGLGRVLHDAVTSRRRPMLVVPAPA